MTRVIHTADTHIGYQYHSDRRHPDFLAVVGNHEGTHAQWVDLLVGHSISSIVYDIAKS